MSVWIISSTSCYDMYKYILTRDGYAESPDWLQILLHRGGGGAWQQWVGAKCAVLLGDGGVGRRVISSWRCQRDDVIACPPVSRLS